MTPGPSYIHLYEAADEMSRDTTAEISPLYHALEQATVRYSDEESLGEGGMKEVVRTYDAHTERHVALARPKSDTGPERYDAFLREAHITARLEHPNIIKVFDMGIDDQRRPFFTMELKSGLSLRRLLSTLRKSSDELQYPYAKRLTIILRVCEAMAYAHSRHVLHLDLKPENIQVGTFGEVQVCDWGMGEIERGISDEHLSLALLDPDLYGDQLEPAVKGTPGYMAPEQDDPQAAMTTQTDIFALGCMLYEASTLRSPSERLTHPPSSPAIAAIVSKACAQSPADRYQNAEAIREDIRRHITGYSPAAEQSGFYREARLFYRRNRFACLITFCFSALLLGSGLLFTHQLRQSYAEKTRALEETEIALAVAETAQMEAKAQQLVAENALKRAQLESAFASALFASRGDSDLDGSTFLSNVMILDEELSPVVIGSLLREIDRSLDTNTPNEGRLVTMKAQVLFMAQRFDEAEEYYAIRAGGQADIRGLIPEFAPLVVRNGLLPVPDLLRLFQQLSDLKTSRHPLMEKMIIYDTWTRKSPADSAQILEGALHISNPDWTDPIFDYRPADRSLHLSGSGLSSLYRRGARRGEKEIPVRSLLRVLDIRRLDLRGSSLTDLWNLEGMKLRTLDLRETEVTDLIPLTALPTLRELIIVPDQFDAETIADLPDTITVVERPLPEN